MKSLKLVFTLALLACLVATTALAGVSGKNGANTVQSNGQVQVYDRTESDIPSDRVQKSSAPVRVDAALASPKPEQINAAALSKYPTVSAAGLSGLYTIPGDFPDLVSAAAVLNFVGLDGDATFELTSTSYASGTVNIGGTYPNAGTYNLTITVSLGNDVTYDFTSTATNGKGFVFNGAKNVTIDGVDDDSTSLTIGMASYAPFPLSDPMGSTIYITGASDEISVLNATVKGVVNNPVWELQTEGRSCVFVFAATADGGPSSNLTFDNDVFISGTIGLKLFPETPAVTVEEMTVNNCRFGGAFGGRLIIGSFLEYGARVTFTNNQVKDIYWLDWYWNNLGTEFVEDVAFGVGNIYYNLGQMTAWHHLAIDGGTYAYNVVDGMSGDNSPGTISYMTRTFGANNGYAAPHEVNFHHNRAQNIFLDHSGQSLVAIRGGTGHYNHNTIRLTGTKVINTAWTSNCLNGATTAYNNIFSNEILGGAASTRRGVQAGGTIDYNAIYSSGVPAVGQTTVAGAVAAGINPNGLFGPVGTFSADLHITGGSSTAKEVGKALVNVGPDIDGAPIDTTVAGKRDAGADQFSPAGTLAGADVLPSAIGNPPAGVPVGVPQTPTVTVKNNSLTPASFSVTLTATGGYSDVQAYSIPAGGTQTKSFLAWTPASAIAYTFTATSALGGDIDILNDAISKIVTASSPEVVVSPKTYTFDAGAESWTGSVDWIRSSSFSKLGGVNGGAGASWVTVQGGASTAGNKLVYTEGAYATSQGYAATYPGANILMSPWLNISGFAGTDLYIALQHSIETEPLWDRSWLQYTVDGITWTTLGTLNDANGINWYNQSLYEHALFDIANFDTATLENLYGIPRPLGGSWTSNDNGTTGAPGSQVPVGPSGYVYSQLHVTETSHAALVGSPNVRFRYIAYSDAVGSYGGWAFDNFKLSDSPFIFTGGTIDGHAWNDVNGNGVDDGEADITATKVYIALFGSIYDSTTTNGTGDYSFPGTVTLPAGYDVTLNVTGTAFTVPFGTSNKATVNHPSDGSTISQNFGTFTGTISGKKYSDINDNGVNDGEAGLVGWTIEVHRDSTHGAFVASDVTDVAGLYSMTVPAYAGTYYVTEIAQPSVARQSGPVGGFHTASITGGTPTATNLDFGNFVYGKIRVQLTVDQNGNGTREAGDIIAVPSGFSSSFKLTKDGVGYSADSVFTLGNGVIAASFDSLDYGTYVVQELDSIAGWRRTKGGLQGMILTQGGMIDTSDYLDFKYLVITGNKFNDMNGNGVKEGGEPGLAGWTIAVVGGVYYGSATAVTDSLGNYSIDSVFTGSHVVGEILQSGWTRTLPGGAGTYAISGISGNFVNTTGKDFGNFDNSDVSGVVYRDYNGNGVMDGADAPMVGVSVGLSVNGGSDVSDGTGYSFNGLITIDTVRITVPGGFVISQPLAGEYPVALLSGGAATSRNFGLFQSTDSSTKYRTFTADQLGADAEKKPGKAPKAGKPYDPVKNKPNTANLVDQLIGKTGQAIGAIKVGISGQLNAGGKTKAYVVPNKQSAFWSSLNNKSAHHTGMARGFDVDIKGKPFLKLQKAFAPNKKQNNKLFGELLALQLNLVASGLKTPAGLGTLIYSDANSQFDGMTIDEIADYADTIMTNFEFMPLGEYTALDTVAAKINGAFYFPATDDTAQGWASPKLTWKAYTSVSEVPFLKPNPGAAPKNRHTGETVESVPTEFALSQNYPNPFNPTTTIEFDLPQASIVTLKIYNLLGQEVATLFDREEIELSETVEFDASSLPSGVYLYRIVAETIADADAGIASETFTQVKKMVLVK